MLLECNRTDSPWPGVGRYDADILTEEEELRTILGRVSPSAVM